MSHMQPDITEKQEGWEVETSAGTEFIPGEVLSVPYWLKLGVVVDASADAYQLLCELVRDYVGGKDIVSVEAIGPHYFARLSAPGYLDCTEWCAFKTIKEAREYLRDL